MTGPHSKYLTCGEAFIISSMIPHMSLHRSNAQHSPNSSDEPEMQEMV